MRHGNVCAVLALLLACTGNERPGPALACTQPDSAAGMPLLFSNAIYGMRGSTGGVLLELGLDSAGWRAVLEPIWSDFPREDDRWPEMAETLAVQWTDPATGRGRLTPGPSGFTADNRLSLGDSLSLTLRCDSAMVVRWHQGGQPDTVALERRRNRGWPS